jgi:MAP/microtubule affinity-regulating kinase
VIEGGFRPPDEFTITPTTPRHRVSSPADMDVSVLAELERLGYSADLVMKSVCGDLYDDIAATYYLVRDSMTSLTPYRSNSGIPAHSTPSIVVQAPIPAAAVGAAQGTRVPIVAKPPPSPPPDEMDAVPKTRNRSATHAGEEVPPVSSSPLSASPVAHNMAVPPKDLRVPIVAVRALTESHEVASSRPTAKHKGTAAAPKYATMKTPGSKKSKSSSKGTVSPMSAVTPTVAAIVTSRGPSPASPTPEPRKSIDLERVQQQEEDWVIVEALPAADLSTDERVRYDEYSRKMSSDGTKKPGTVRHFFSSLTGRRDSNAHTEPRSVRFAFSVHMTSTKPAAEMLDAIRQVLGDTNPPIEFQQEHEFCLKCSDPKARVQFEIEICRLPQLSVNGIRFHRLRGDSWRYKTLCKELLSQFRL